MLRTCASAPLALVALAFFAVRCPADDAAAVDVSGGIAHVSVGGTVLDPKGRPCPNARVALRITGSDENGQRLGVFDPDDVLAEVRADDMGRFVINGAPIDATLADVIEQIDHGQRSFDIMAMADGFALGWTPIYGLPSADEINVSLQPAATLEGKVEDDAGAGLD
ncbi:MAG: hypothetical protein ACREHD_08655, partial [Pirellulales bacterium]